MSHAQTLAAALQEIAVLHYMNGSN